MSNGKTNLSEYSIQFAACRDMGHQWDVSAWYSGKRSLVCWNCDTSRMDEIDHRGILTKRHYKYPTGYHVKKTPFLIREIRKQLSREAQKLSRWVGEKEGKAGGEKKTA